MPVVSEVTTQGISCQNNDYFLFLWNTPAWMIKKKNKKNLPKPQNNQIKIFTLWSEAAGILVTVVIISKSMAISFCYPLFFHNRLS